MWLHEFCLGGTNGCWVSIFDIFAASMAWRYFIQTSVTSSGFHFLQTSFIIYYINLFRQGIWKSLWHFLSDPGTAWVLLQKNSWILTRENLCGASVEATEVMFSNKWRTNGLMTSMKGSLSCKIKSGNGYTFFEKFGD